MKRLGFGLYFVLFSSGLLHAGEAELKASAKTYLAAQAAVEKMAALEKQWNAKWVGRKLTHAEKQQSSEELSALNEIGLPAVEAKKEASSQLWKQVVVAGIDAPDNVDLVALSEKILSGSVSAGISQSKSDSGISSISAKVTSRSSLPETSSQTGYIYDVKVTVALSGPSDGYTEVALSTEGEAASSEGGAPIVGNNGLVLKPGVKSVTGTIKIKSYVVQRVTITAKVGDSSDSVTIKLK